MSKKNYVCLVSARRDRVDEHPLDGDGHRRGQSGAFVRRRWQRLVTFRIDLVAHRKASRKSDQHDDEGWEAQGDMRRGALLHRHRYGSGAFRSFT